MSSLKANETGAALVTAILVLMLVSGLTLGMYSALASSSRAQAADRDQSVAYAAAHAGLEKLTSSLAELFAVDFSPSAGQIDVIDSTPPPIPGFTYTAPGGTTGSGYQITYTPIASGLPNAGDPAALADADITTGPFEGFKGLITPYTLTVTARSTTGNSEVRLRRELQTVAVPVFQFGIFGEKSLGFHAGPDFDFGGRVHTNESLFLANGDGNMLIFRDKITAVTQVVRDKISNGIDINLTNHEGTVRIPKVIGGAYPGSYRDLAKGESSGTSTGPCIKTGNTTNSNCWIGWKALSESTYGTTIRTAATGARRLDLPLTSDGATPIDLIRRPAANENTNNPPVFGQRYFTQASLRILLSDRASDITGLPTIVTATAPMNLDDLSAGGFAEQAGRPDVPVSPGPEANRSGAVSYTKVSAFSGTTLNIQTTTNGTSWTDGVPAWLRWTRLEVGGGPTVFDCHTLSVVSSRWTLQGCTSHGSIAAGATVTFRLADGSAVTGVTHASSSSSNNIIFVNSGGSTFNPALKFASTRVFFVGEIPVTCNGFAGTTAGVSKQLLGCSYSAGSIANNDRVYTGATTAANTPLLGGFIKIERQRSLGVWDDVTLELLELGFASANQQGADCGDPTADAVIRLMRLRDNGLAAGGCTGGANYGGSLIGTDFWPLTLFDAREGWTRLLPEADGMHMNGLFGYVAFDARNFSRWIAGTIGSTGNQTWNNNGYIIYFSDRRGDHDETQTGDPETGEYGNEDWINPGSSVWAKSNALEAGENFNESRDPVTNAETMQTYGETPHSLTIPNGATGAGMGGTSMGFDGGQRPWSTVDLMYSGRGRLARPVLFRRALKIINGGIVSGVNNLPASGINIVAENPIYVQGNFNATTSVTQEPNVAAAIIGDSITLLSNAFNDAKTFQFPNKQSSRVASDTGYRFAMITGKSIPFPKPGWGVQELGSDGGVHNFMKMLENWSGRELNYRGSMVSLYFSRQAIGIYRADGNVYGAPTRGYNFDVDFLSPPLLPPGTPMFRDINTLKFRQILRPNQ